MTTQIPLNEIDFNEDYYPRWMTTTDWRHVLGLLNALKANQQLDPIDVARSHKRGTLRYMCLDGFHRIDAHRKHGLNTINATIHQIPPTRWLETAITLNIKRKKSLSGIDIAHNSARLDRLGMPKAKQAQLMHLPVKSLEAIRAKHITLITANKGITQPTANIDTIITKAPLHHVVGKTRLAKAAANRQAAIIGEDTNQTLDSLIALLQIGIDTTNPHTMEKLQTIYELLTQNYEFE
jgi:hypothetical protein